MRESLFTRRSNYTLLLLGFLLAAVLFTVKLAKQQQDIRQRAQGGISFNLVPARTTILVGEETDVDLTIDTGTTNLSAADFQISFDPAIISVTSISNGDFFDSNFIIAPGSISGNTARIVLGNNPTQPRTGSGVAARLHVRGNASGAGTLTLASSSRISLIDGTLSTPPTVSTTITVGQEGVTTPSTVLSLQPGNISVNPGDTLYLPVHIDTGSNQVTSVDLAIIFDTQRFDGVSLSNAGFMPNTTVAPSISGGVAKIVVDNYGTAKSGTGVLAVLTLKAKNVQGTTSVSLDPSTIVRVASSNQNMVSRLDSTVVTIGASSTSPTPYIGGVCVLSRPAAPTSINAVVLNSRQVFLNWSGVSGATHYGIVYGVDSHVYIYGAANVGNVTSYTVSNLTPGKRYYFAVFVVNDCAPSDYSYEVGATVPTAYTYITPTPAARTPSPTPGVYTAPTPQPSAVTGVVESEFKPINPNSDALSFLSIKPRPSASPSPVGLFGFGSGGGNLVIYNLLWILVAILIILIIIYILYRSRERDEH